MPFIQVTASAGSGKTFELTRRFLALLLGSRETARPVCVTAPPRRHAPAEIMAITFTNKAAAEMRLRLIAALKTLALGLPSPLTQAGEAERAAAASHLEGLFRHAQRLNIRTIDSLLTMLARLFAAELGLSPGFTNVFDASEIARPVYDRLLSLAESGDQGASGLFTRAVAAFRGAKGFLPLTAWNARLQEIFALRLADPRPLNATPDDLIRLAGATAAPLAAAAAAMTKALEADGLDPKVQFAAAVSKCAALDPLDDPPDSAFFAKDSLGECLKLSGKARLTPGHEALFAALVRAVREHAGTAALARSGLDLLPFTWLADAALDPAATPGGEEKNAPHARIPALVGMLLQRQDGVPEAFCRLGARLNHLLIDEFQDTSVAQWRALFPLAGECLAKGGELCLVGDVKQAIYGWRGGEAGLFAAAASDPELTDMAEPVIDRLAFNWRSARKIVAVNNAFFTALAGPQMSLTAARILLPQTAGALAGGLARQIEESFAGAAQTVPERSQDVPKGRVLIIPTPGASGEQMLNGVKDALHEALCLDLLTRRAPGDVAVLAQTNAQAGMIFRWLLEWDVPAVTENSLLLSARPVIRQLTALLAFLDYPLNDPAFFEFVGGHEVFGAASGLTRERMVDWLCAQPGAGLYPRFREDFPEVFRDLIQPFLSQAGLASPYDLLCEAVRAYDLFARRPQDAAFIRRFLELAHLAGERGHASLAAFLDFCAKAGAEETAPGADRPDAVRVMTIHKAKGLEFKAVIVPIHAGRTVSVEETAIVERGGLRFAARLGPHAGESYARALTSRALERLNMLYVAWTRASEELVIFHQHEADGGGPLPALMRAVFPALGIDPAKGPVVLGERPPSAPAPDIHPGAPDAMRPPGPSPARPAAPPMRWLPRLKVFRSDVAGLKPGKALPETARGEAVHKALEHFRPGRGQDAAALAIRRALCDLALPGDIRDALGRELLDMLGWLAAQPGFPALLDTGEREREIVDDSGALWRPDLVAELADAVMVADYKTGTRGQDHPAQVRRYLRLITAIEERSGTGRKVRGLIVYLDQRQIVPVALGSDHD